jgi:hypothetical protein
MHRIVDWAKLHHFSHIIWDIDGTITERDKLSEEATIKIINLALKGVYHSFITGRDGDWIIANVIQPMSKFFHFGMVNSQLDFFAEVGCVFVTSTQPGRYSLDVNPSVADHPLITNKNGIRDKLRGLVYDPQKLEARKKGHRVSLRCDVIHDANGVAYCVDRSKSSPNCYPYVWSVYKKAFATFEKVRDEDGKVKTFEQQPYEDIALNEIKKAGFSESIKTEVVSTAINVIPVVDGLSLGKSWAAGIAIKNVAENKLHGAFSTEDVLARTVAIGDGLSDLDFTEPTFSHADAKKLTRKSVPIIFVGQQSDLPKAGQHKERLLKNIIIQATGHGELQFMYTAPRIELTPATGPRVVSAILDFLKNWDYFGGFS